MKLTFEFPRLFLFGFCHADLFKKLRSTSRDEEKTANKLFEKSRDEDEQSAQVLQTIHCYSIFRGS